MASCLGLDNIPVDFIMEQAYKTISKIEPIVSNEQKITDQVEAVLSDQ
jgi:hypothetical protein